MEKTTFTLGEAHIVTGYAKSKISTDIKNGVLSCTREKPEGPVQIQGQELVRVYGADRYRPERLKEHRKARSGTVLDEPRENDDEQARMPRHGGVLEAEVSFLREKLLLIETMKDGEIKQLNARIEDMRRSVDDAQEQRDNAMRMLNEQIAVTKLLTDQRAKETAIPMPPPDQPPPSGHGPINGQVGRRGGFLGLFGRRSA